MRICLVTPYDLSHDGGVNRHVITLAEALRRLGHTTQVMGPASRETPSSCDSFRGVVPIRANGSRARVGLLVSPNAVRRYLEQGNFDLVHVHEPWVPGPARYAVQYSQAPVIATFHTYAESESRIAHFGRRALARPLRRLHCGIAVSNHAAEYARGVFGGPIHVVPNGIEMGTFAALHPCRGSDIIDLAPRESGPLRALFVGRFDEPRKGLRHLLAAAARIRASGREIQVRVVGFGDRQPFQALARAAGAEFVGRVSDVALVDMYRWCDVFCAPSTHGESFGVVLIEAMASGRPVVASDIPGYRDACMGAAILVPPADPAALAEAILRTADDATLRLRLVRQGWQRAHELAWSRVVLSIMSLYEGAAPGRAMRPGAIDVPA